MAEAVGEGIPPEVADDLVGRRVVGEINAACGDCPRCLQGLPKHCERRTVLGIAGRSGAFADYLTLPVSNLHAVPERLSTAAAVFTEPLAAALEITERLPASRSGRALVVGAGKLGTLIAQTLAVSGCEPLVVSRSRSGGVDLLEHRGIRTTAASEIVAGSFDLAVECTGNPDGFAVARRGLRPRGTLVLKSTYAGTLVVDAASLVVDEITVIGSRCGPFAPALRLLDQGEVEVKPLVEARYGLEAGLEGFERAARPGALKVLLETQRSPATE